MFESSKPERGKQERMYVSHQYYDHFRGMDTCSGEVSLLFCLPSEKGSTIKGNKLLPMGLVLSC